MKNLLVGNGINCQFDPTSYTSKQIVLRILKNCNRRDFPTEIIVDAPVLLKDYLGLLFLEARKALVGEYDVHAVSTAEKESLQAFKEKYVDQAERLKMTDICFEDYYLLHDLACHSIHIGNPDQYTVRESMRSAYLYAIYNDGKLDQLYRLYPDHVVAFLQSHDRIFTTNYDSNLESATGKSVNHLHGQFDRLSDVYNEESLRNKLPDCPIRDYKMDPQYYYLYSNAITTHCGSYKETYIKQHSTANAVVLRMASVYQNDPKIKAEVDSWLTNENSLVCNLGHAIVLKASHPDLCFSEQYDFESFEKMSGELDILGLSPWNDYHIFRAINNSAICKCVYYFHGENDCKKVTELLPSLAKTGTYTFRPQTRYGRTRMAKKHKPGKIVFIPANETDKWFRSANVFAKSLISRSEAIRLFNNLSAETRIEICKELSEYDSIRKNAFPHDMTENEITDQYTTSVMVDAHILGTEYGTDPVVVLMCVNPPCKPNQKVIVR